MTPAEEASFIQLWQEGASYKAIAAALDCPIGTVASRSAVLAAQGKITPRQRGGAYSSQRAKAQPGSGTGEGVSTQTPQGAPVDTPGVQKGVSAGVQSGACRSPPLVVSSVR